MENRVPRTIPSRHHSCLALVAKARTIIRNSWAWLWMEVIETNEPT